MTINHPFNSLSAVPVMPVHMEKSTFCMPTGRFICLISPARRKNGTGKIERK
jgi:hypothetical protein